MKFVTYTITAIFLSVLASCSCQDTTEKKARIDGMKEAINVMSNIGKGDMAMEEALLEAKATMFEYAKSDTVAAKQFDKSFRNYIISHNDSLAKKIF